MPRESMFVVLDDLPHVLVGDEHTACGLLVPHGTNWSTTQPDDLCDECADKTGIEKPKAAKKK